MRSRTISNTTCVCSFLVTVASLGMHRVWGAASLSAHPAANETGQHGHDSSLHLFVDDYHIRSRFAMKRVCGKLEKHPTPVVTDRTMGAGPNSLVVTDGTYYLYYTFVDLDESPQYFIGVATGTITRE